MVAAFRSRKTEHIELEAEAALLWMTLVAALE